MKGRPTGRDDAKTAAQGVLELQLVDDAASWGKLRRVRRMLKRMMRRRHMAFWDVAIFQDKERLAIGDAWEAEIRDAIGRASIFIPIVTENYLKSTPCLNELMWFSEHEARLVRKNLIFPILCISRHRLEQAKCERPEAKDLLLNRTMMLFLQQYAARADGTAPRFWGDGFATASRYAWSGQEGTLPVGAERQANRFGLVDMLGNTWEWIADTWHGSYQGAPTDGSACLNEDERHFRRGGSRGDSARLVRTGVRGHNGRHFRSAFIGFRVARTIV